MREIKFRAWDKFYKEMTYDIQHCQGQYECDYCFGDYLVSYNDQYEVMQYTGLKDKNGKEGYHKDLVKGEHSIYLIEWDEEEAEFFLKYVKDLAGLKRINIVDHFMTLLNQMEIVGTIYENPELLGN